MDEHIHRLLHEYDCVIVPELGGFITEDSPARIDERLHVVYPPSKELRFNVSLQKSDGLLAQHISEQESITHEAANDVIRLAVEDHVNRLNEGQRVVLEKVGILYLDSHRNVQFRPDESVNYLLDAFGLKPVIVHPTVVKTAAEAKELAPVLVPEVRGEENVIATPIIPLEPKPEVEETPIAQDKRRITHWWAAALVPLLFYLGFVAYRGDVLQDGHLQMSDLNPFRTVEEAQYTLRPSQMEADIPSKDVTDYSEDSASVRLAEVYIPLEKEVLELPIDSTSVDMPEPKSILLRYHVVGGCFSEQGNADRMVRRLQRQGFKAYVLDVNKGLHRVVYGSYADKNSALEALGAAKEDQSGAWLLRKEVQS